jgi:hypothetical protein
VLPLLLCGCPTDIGGFTDGEGPDDDDDTSGDDDDDGEALGPGGYFGVWYWEQPPTDDDDDYQAVAGFSASFDDTIVASIPGEGGIDWASPETEECVVTTWDADDTIVTGGVPGEYEEMDAGVLTLSSPSWSVDLVAWDHVGPSQYYFELNPDYDVHFEAFYEVSCQGADFPAFESVAELLVPAALHLTSPLPSETFEVSDEDFVVTWDGGSLDEIWIEFHASDEFEYDNVQINCVADNDGSFTIPADLVTQLPQGELLVLALQQPRTETLVVGDIEVDVGSGASAQASGERL